MHDQTRRAGGLVLGHTFIGQTGEQQVAERATRLLLPARRG